MIVGFIGYGNHAKRLKKILSSLEKIDKYLFYHPYKKNKDTVNNLKDVLNVHFIFITSPNDTHFFYVDYFLKNSKAKIFCEKPPATKMNDLKVLSGLKNYKKQRIFFNFNYRFSLLSNLLTETNNSKDLGKILNINLNVSHGLAFKETYKDSWRSNHLSLRPTVLDTSAIHFIDLLQFTYGNAKIVSYQNTIGAKGNISDTININLKHNNGIFSNVFASYAAPYQLHIHITGTNGIMILQGNKIRYFSPRDTFDEQGMFSSPPENKHKNYFFDNDYLSSLEASLIYFFTDKKSDKSFLDHYDLSISTMSQIIEINKCR